MTSIVHHQVQPPPPVCLSTRYGGRFPGLSHCAHQHSVVKAAMQPLFIASYKLREKENPMKAKGPAEEGRTRRLHRPAPSLQSTRDKRSTTLRLQSALRLIQEQDFFFFSSTSTLSWRVEPASDQTSEGARFDERDGLHSPFLPSILSLQLHPGKVKIHSDGNELEEEGSQKIFS